MDLQEAIRTIPDFPKKGILFRDITTLLQNPVTFTGAVQAFADRFRRERFELIAGIEARGFIFGAALACSLNKGFIPVRKPGKLPGPVYSAEYALEYGSDCIEMHTDAVRPGDGVLLVDDLLATGGTMKAACELIERAGGNVAACAFLVELSALNGRQVLGDRNVVSLVVYDET